MYEGICDAIHRELDSMDERLSSGKTPLNSQDLEHIDKMAHALKSLKTYEAMEGHSEYGGSYDGSYARGRSRVTGRYVSRDGYEPEYRRY
jgi:hypothetical protein